MREIELTQGQVALVDDQHYDAVARFRWFAHWNSCVQAYYARRRLRRNGVPAVQALHTFIGGLMGLDLSGDRTVDHRNRMPLDCRSENLRSATKSQQQHNQRRQSNNTSGYIGVYRSGDRWRACISTHGKLITLGYFSDPISAAHVRDDYVRAVRGEFATLNNPPERRAA